MTETPPTSPTRSRIEAGAALRRIVPALLIALAACQNGLLDRLPRQPERWKRLQPSISGPVLDLLRDPSDPQWIYASIRNEIVMRSNNHGEAWVSANTGLPRGTEVPVLADAPPGLVGEGRGLLAGTDGAGVYVSVDHANSWQPLGGSGLPPWDHGTINSLIALPERSGRLPVLVAGTDGSGVLVSDDGETWEARNDGLDDEGLGNPTVQAVVADPICGLVASTGSGRLYHSADQGRHWSPFGADLDGKVVSTMEIDDSGTLWVGLKNAGLAARIGCDDGFSVKGLFEPQGGSLLERTNILTVHASGSEIVAGTMGEGVVVGRYGDPFVLVNEGLESTTVSAVLLDPERPGEMILGTGEGLYRSVEPPARAWPAVLGAALISLALAAGSMAWQRSDRAVVARAFRELGKLSSPVEISNYLNRFGMELPLKRRGILIERLARRLDRAKGDPHGLVADCLRSSARVVVQLERSDSAARHDIAAAMGNLADILDRIGAQTRIFGIKDWDVGASPLALQMRLFAALISAESPGHLAAVRSRLQEISHSLFESPLPFPLDVGFLEELQGILGALEQFSRLPTAEDRALSLGQALTRTLQAQDRITERYASRPTVSLAIAVTVLDSLRQLLATLTQDIRQRAELKMVLRSRVLTARREAVVVLEVTNAGQGHAHDLVVELLEDADTFRVLQPHQAVKSLLRRQSARFEFLVEPKVSDRVRLSFRVTYGDLYRHDQRLEFADVVQFRQPAMRTFLPLHPNPYVVGRPLAESDVFIGRDKTFKLLTANFRGAHQDNVVILIGQRRMGKTSILRRLPARLGHDYAPVLIDLQGLLGSGEAAFFREIVAVIHDELAEAGVAVEEPPAADFELDPAGVFKRRFLRQARKALGDRRLLLMFDEFEVLEERIRCGDLKPQVLPYFRSLMQHEEQISFMFAGTHRLDELTDDYWGVLFNMAVYFDVGHLSQAQVEELFTRPTRQTFEIDPLAIDKIFQTTGGHPHFSQLLARELAELCNREKLSYVTVQDVNVVTRTVVDKGQLHVAYLWDEASRSERLLLLALKELIEREGLASTAAAHRYLIDHRIEPGDLPAAARRLRRLEILTENAGLLSFRMDLLRRWLERHYDLESFVLSEGGGGRRS